MAEKKKDTQSNQYQITINNPLEKGFTHETIFKILTINFTTVQYFCMADEQGEQGTLHTHIYAYFKSRVRFSMVKKYFDTAHIETVKGTVTDNINYIKKEGKWEHDGKHGTKIEGTFLEWGNRPADSKGKREDMSELYQMISDGLSNAEILAINQDYILQIDKLDKLRTTLLTEQYKNTIRKEMKCIYIYGETGAGKTRSVLEKHGCADTYRITDYEHPFDGYSCQPVIAFDEFRNSLRLKDMLSFCDIYPIELPARYSNKFACYNTIYIISNWELEKQYADLQQTDKESWKAFLRRITEVWVYEKEGKIKYPSVNKYLKRKETFHTIPSMEQMEIPFEKGSAENEKNKE